MDSSNVGLNIAGGGIVATVLGVLLYVIKTVNHSKVKSKCCGKRCDASLDIDSTLKDPPTPEEKPTIKTPNKEEV